MFLKKFLSIIGSILLTSAAIPYSVEMAESVAKMYYNGISAGDVPTLFSYLTSGTLFVVGLVGFAFSLLRSSKKHEGWS